MNCGLPADPPQVALPPPLNRRSIGIPGHGFLEARAALGRRFAGKGGHFFRPAALGAAGFTGGCPLAALPTTVPTFTPIALQIMNKVSKLGTFTPFSMNVIVLWSRPAFCAKASFDKPSLAR